MWELTIATFKLQANGERIKTSQEVEGMYETRQAAENAMLLVAEANNNPDVRQLGYLKSPIGMVYFLDPFDRFWFSYPLLQT